MPCARYCYAGAGKCGRHADQSPGLGVELPNAAGRWTLSQHQRNSGGGRDGTRLPQYLAAADVAAARDSRGNRGRAAAGGGYAAGAVGGGADGVEGAEGGFHLGTTIAWLLREIAAQKISERSRVPSAPGHQAKFGAPWTPVF